MAEEAEGKTRQVTRMPPAALNERILSSMSQKHVAAHPWHDLEIGIVHSVLRYYHIFMFS
jgi:inorganic pyrophosphatase